MMNCTVVEDVLLCVVQPDGVREGGRLLLGLARLEEERDLREHRAAGHHALDQVGGPKHGHFLLAAGVSLEQVGAAPRRRGKSPF